MKSHESTLLLKNQSSAHLFPILVSIFAAQGALLFGYNVGFSSPISNYVAQNIVTPYVGEAKNVEFMKDLAFSFLNVGAIPGSLMASSIAESIGRRKALLLSAVPFIIGVILLTADISSYICLCMARFVCGIAVGSVSVLVPLYITEISPPNLRGSLGALNQLFITIGILIVNALGFAVGGSDGIVHTDEQYRLMGLLMLIPVGLLIIAVSIGPETPRWLLGQGKREEAYTTLLNLRQTTMADVEEEIDDISLNMGMNESFMSSEVGLPLNNSISVKKFDAPSLSDLFSKSARAPFFIGITLMVLQQWSGVNGITYNVTSLIGGSGGVIFAAVQVGCTLVASLYMESFGRRVFLQGSTFFMGASILIFGILDKETLISIHPSLGTVLSVFYIAAFSFGVGPIPWLICVELYPSSVRSLAVSWSTVVNWTMGFLVTLTFSAAQASIGLSGLFFLYATVCWSGTLFVFMYVPETKGKTLEEVEQIFA